MHYIYNPMFFKNMETIKPSLRIIMWLSAVCYTLLHIETLSAPISEKDYTPPPVLIVADLKSTLQPLKEDCAGDSGDAPESQTLSSLDRELPMPPAVRALEEGASAGEERAALEPDYTERVMTLLGMSHRLFVPRLLAVRDN